MCSATTGIAPKRVFALALCCIALCAFAARRADARQQPQPPDPEKAALIKELVALTNSGGSTQELMEAVTAEVRKERARVFEMTINEMGHLSQAEREALVRKEREDSARLDERINEVFRQKIDMNKMVDEVSYVVYDRHFTTEELRDLIAFYKTPTGRKSIEAMPRLFADSMAETNKRLNPVLDALLKQLIEEERQRLEKILPPKPQPKPTPKRAPAKRRQ